MGTLLDYVTGVLQKLQPTKIAYQVLLASLLCFLGHLEAAYIQVYTTTNNGALSWTGNVLGLTKATNTNEPGVNESIGAFITTNTSLKVGNYPEGTTLDYTQNGSSAILDLPSGSTILYAELIWSGSYGFGSAITSDNMVHVTLTTPDGNSHDITPRADTAQAVPPFQSGPGPGGFYVRSANVTTLVTVAGSYTVGGVPATVVAKENSSNCAGWTLAVAYQNPNMLTSNLNLYVACEPSGNPPASVQNFQAPTTGTISSRLFVSAVEGDVGISGDQFLVGDTSTLNPATDALSGTNNPINNFFASQINTLLPLTVDPNGKFIASGSSKLDQRGTFGTINSIAGSGTVTSGARQGYDITSIDISDRITNGQTVLYAQGTTTGDGYGVTGLGIQIQVSAPVINAQISANPTSVTFVGDTIEYTVALKNNGDADAANLTFNDNLPTGLAFVAGSLTIDGTSSSANLQNLSIGNLTVGSSRTLAFKAQVTQINPPTSYDNLATITYFNTGGTVPLTTNTNTVTVTFETPPPPVANSDTASTSANIILESPSVLTNDTGIDISISLYQESTTAGGKVLMRADGAYRYDPPLDFSGIDTFNYTIVDSFGQLSNSATVTITVLPLAVGDSESAVGANTPLNETRSVLDNDIGTGLSIASFQTPTDEGGTVSMNSDGTYTYQPPTNFSGIDSFNYTLKDAAQNTAEGVVSITVLPAAKDDVGTTPANTPLNGSTLFTNDVGKGLTLVRYNHTSVQGGQVVMNKQNGEYTYTPPQNFSGIDTFTYTVKDQAGNKSKATVTITVTPVTFPDSSSTPINQTLNQVFSVLENDIGSGLSIVKYDQQSVRGGIVQMQTDGTYTYTPPHNLVGADSFSYTLSDSSDDTASNIVTIYITNNYPNDKFITYANQTLIGSSVLSNDPAVGLRVIQFQNPSNRGGFVSMNEDGTFTYVPPRDFSGVDSFLYLATDSAGQTYSATVTITVLPLVKPLTFETGINTQLTGNVLTGAVGTGLRVTAFQNPSSEGGTVAVNPDGSFTYNPKTNFVGTDSFTFTVTDTSGNSVLSTVTVVVTGTPPPSGPTLISIDPSFGPEEGGTEVTIKGTNFIHGSTQVFFGVTPASNVVVHSDNTLIAIAPPGTGVVDITIKTPSGSSAIVPADQYTYTQTPPQGPTLISIDPSFGPEKGGTLVTIKGTNFINGSTQVFFGVTPASNVVVHSDNTLIATAPPGTGVVDVTIKTSSGSSAIVPADQYTYISAPPPIKVLPPRHFRGTIKKYEFLNKTDYELKASWDASKSSDIAFYRIYHKGKLVKQVRAKKPLKIELHLKSKHARRYSITAVDVNGNESTPTKLRIKHG